MSFTVQLGQDTLPIEAGATSAITVTITNKGSEQERFELDLEGIDPEWKAVPVPVFTVEPGETHSEKALLKPPRTSESQAGNYPFVVKVRSLISGETKTVQAMLQVKPFHLVTMEISPRKGSFSPVSKQNTFSLTLMNLGNTEHTLQLVGNDPEDACAFQFENEQVTLGPGQQREVEVIANPTKSRVISSGRLIGFSITARSIEHPSVVATAQAQLEQRSLLSPTSLGILAFIAIIVIAWTMMMPKPPGIQLTIEPLQATLGSQVTAKWTAHDGNAVRVTAGDKVVYDGADLNRTLSFPVDDLKMSTIRAVVLRDGKEVASDTKTLSLTEAPKVDDPQILTFKAASRKVPAGKPFEISYEFNDAVTRAVLGPDQIELNPQLKAITVTPTTPGIKKYTIAAYNKANVSVTKEITVEVLDLSDAKIVRFVSFPAQVKQEEGGKVTIEWTVNKAVSVELQQGEERPNTVLNSGSQDFVIDKDTIFTINAFDENGRKATQQITVRFVKTPDPNPTDGTTPPAGSPASPTTTGPPR